MRRPENAANASVTYRWSSKWSANAGSRYAGPSYDDADTGAEVKLGGYVLFDLRTSYELRDRLELYARVENVAGRHYETAYEYGTLGRVAYAGLRATFEGSRVATPERTASPHVYVFFLYRYGIVPPKRAPHRCCGAN